MKIAIPTVNGLLNAHFGHCEKFAILDVDQESKTITGIVEVVPPPHEPGLLPKWLAEKKVDLVIAGGMGQRAQSLFTENKIKLIIGAPSNSAEDLVKCFLEGNLISGENICDH